MKINEMYINNHIERIDNNQVKKDNQGYYIEKWDGGNIFYPTYNKIYLTADEIKEYLRILDHNSKEDIKQAKIEDAIKNGRVVEVPQYIKKDSKPRAIMYVYFDEQNKIIQI